MAIDRPVIGAVGVAVAATRGGTHGPDAVRVRANSLAELDAKTGRVVKVYRLHHPTDGVAYTKNRVWVGVS